MGAGLAVGGGEWLGCYLAGLRTKDLRWCTWCKRVNCVPAAAPPSGRAHPLLPNCRSPASSPAPHPSLPPPAGILFALLHVPELVAAIPGAQADVQGALRYVLTLECDAEGRRGEPVGWEPGLVEPIAVCARAGAGNGLEAAR